MNLIKFEKWFKSVSKTFALGASQNKHTPFALISDISKNFNFTGGITLVLFNVEIIIDLVYNKKVKPKDIFFYSDHLDKDYIAKKIGANIIKNLNTDDTMKFDNILINPPYDEPIPGKKQTKKVWKDWLYRIEDKLKIGGKLAFISPPSWIESNDASLKKFRNKVLDNNLTHLRLGVEKFFPTVDIQIGYLILTKEKYKGITKFTDENDNSTSIDFRNGIPKSFEEQSRLDLVNKIIASTPNKYKWYYGEKGQIYPDTLKLVINYSRAYYSDSDKDKNMPITKNEINNKQVCILINSTQEGEMHKSWLHSKAIRWLCDNYKKRGQTGFCDAVKRQIIPKFNTKIWTDIEVYKELGLTKNEIDVIEKSY